MTKTTVAGQALRCDDQGLPGGGGGGATACQKVGSTAKLTILFWFVCLFVCLFPVFFVGTNDPL